MAYKKKSNAIKSEKATFEDAERSTSFYNKMVFSKMKSKIGGGMRAIMSGGAPLAPQIAEFLKVCFGCPVIVGYGLTETCAALTTTDYDDPHYRHCGPPVLCAELKLGDVPEMNYFTHSNPPCGEIWARGPNISIGYYKDEARTKEDFDSDGWFHTGDVGRWNKDGTLSIIDRRKNIFKLSQGEYIAAENLEHIYGRSKFVAQIFVYGDSYTPFLVAVIVPEPVCLKEWAEAKTIPFDPASLVQNPELKEAILQDFTNLHKENHLQGFEAIKDIIVSKTDFNPENDLTTPTMKLKRPQLKKAFQDQFVSLYKVKGVEIPTDT